MNAKILTMIVIVTLIILSAGCINTQESGMGTATYDLIADTQTIDVDMYNDAGLHVTGKMVLNDDTGEYIDVNCQINGYFEGNNVTGTLTERNGRLYSIFYVHVDVYKNGWHTTGIETREGFNDELHTEIYYDLISTKPGYDTVVLRGYENAEWETI